MRSAERVYIACPKSAYATPRYDRVAELVRQQFPDALIIEARNRYRSNLDWVRGWPATLRTLTHLVFFCDPDGWIGRGVWTEITDAERDGVTAFHVNDRGRLTPLNALQFGPPNEECWQRYCRVVLPEAER